MKLFRLTPLILGVFALPAMAAFDASQWTVTNVGTLIGGSPTLGTATFTTSTLTMVGSDSLSPDPNNFAVGCAGGAFEDPSSPCQLQVTLAKGGNYTFDWSYTTADGNGVGPDIFGILQDGAFKQLSDPGGAAPTQSGTGSFSASSSLGFVLNCTDCTDGAATVTISNFAAAVPEPSTYAMLIAGAFGLAALRRWGRSKD